MTGRLSDLGVHIVLLDIEGTTTPLAFVHDTLFPYARVRLEPWLRDHIGTPSFAEVAESLEREHRAEAHPREHLPAWNGSTPEALVGSMHRYLHWLMDQDRKSPTLKRLQGWLWEAGYRAGHLQGWIYEDVAPALRRWRDQGLQVAIYSSGSELAQRRLFASTREGDLTPLVTGFFDTAVGPKLDPAGYVRIAEALGHPPNTVLFVSDVVPELRAARDAGCQVRLCLRAGNMPQAGARDFEQVSTFADLL